MWRSHLARTSGSWQRALTRLLNKLVRNGTSSFLCLPKEAKADASSRQPLAASACNVGTGNSVLNRWEYGQLPEWDSDIGRRAEEAALILNIEKAADFHPTDLHPNWSKQTLRCLVPCRRTDSYHWRRACSCITLGRLFGVLGQAYSADAIYHFYRTRRIVVAKQRKEVKKRRNRQSLMSMEKP